MWVCLNVHEEKKVSCRLSSSWEHSKILKTQFYFQHCYGRRKTVKNTKDEEKVKENERE